MGILEEIKQKRPFRNEWHKASVNLIFTYNWIQDRSRHVLNQMGITNQQYNVLRILRGSHPQPLSTADIRERMLDKMPDTSRLVDRMVLKGWVKKHVCESDKRLVDVMITPAGIQLLEQLDACQSQIDAFLQGLSKAEAAQLNVLLDKIREPKQP